MIDLEKERKVFEALAYSMKWNIFRFRGVHGLESYVDDFVNGAWFGWQASANREGYKLVPVECTDETAEAIASVASCCGGIADAIYCAVIEST